MIDAARIQDVLDRAEDLPEKVCLLRSNIGLPHRELAAAWCALDQDRTTVICPVALKSVWADHIPGAVILGREEATLHPERIDNPVVILDDIRLGWQSKQRAMALNAVREAECAWVSICGPALFNYSDVLSTFSFIFEAELTGVRL